MQHCKRKIFTVLLQVQVKDRRLCDLDGEMRKLNDEITEQRGRAAGAEQQLTRERQHTERALADLTNTKAEITALTANVGQAVQRKAEQAARADSALLTVDLESNLYTPSYLASA